MEEIEEKTENCSFYKELENSLNKTIHIVGNNFNISLKLEEIKKDNTGQIQYIIGSNTFGKAYIKYENISVVYF